MYLVWQRIDKQRTTPLGITSGVFVWRIVIFLFVRCTFSRWSSFTGFYLLLRVFDLLCFVEWLDWLVIVSNDSRMCYSNKGLESSPRTNDWARSHWKWESDAGITTNTNRSRSLQTYGSISGCHRSQPESRLYEFYCRVCSCSICVTIWASIFRIKFVFFGCDICVWCEQLPVCMLDASQQNTDSWRTIRHQVSRRVKRSRNSSLQSRFLWFKISNHRKGP